MDAVPRFLLILGEKCNVSCKYKCLVIIDSFFIPSIRCFNHEYVEKRAVTLLAFFGGLIALKSQPPSRLQIYHISIIGILITNLRFFVVMCITSHNST